MLKRNHRTMGHVVGSFTPEGSSELTVLQVSPREKTVCESFKLMDVTLADVTLQVRFELAELLERARFLGLDNETLQQVFNEELQKE